MDHVLPYQISNVVYRISYNIFIVSFIMYHISIYFMHIHCNTRLYIVFSLSYIIYQRFDIKSFQISNDWIVIVSSQTIFTMMHVILTNLSQPPRQPTSKKPLRKKNTRKPVVVRWKGLSRGSGDTLYLVLRGIMVAKWRKHFSVVSAM